MQTDWLIVRRLAAELRTALRGRRIRSVGLSADERLVIACDGATLVLDALGAQPVMMLDTLAIADRTRWWVKTLADALEGLRVDDVRGRRGDRLVGIDCSARSRFGVATTYRLIAELVPRFGNVVLLKDDTIVTAAREFRRTAAASRATIAGEPYELPPLPAFEVPVAGALGDALADSANDDAIARARDALRREVPLLPRLIAVSLATEALSLVANGADPASAAERGLTCARTLIEGTRERSDALGDIFVYREAGEIVAAHVVPLAQFASHTLERVPALLPVVAQAFASAATRRVADAVAQRRTSLAARVAKRRTALEAEAASARAERDDAAGRDALRRSGEALYAHLAEVPPGARTFSPPSDPALHIPLDPQRDAKANAAAIFKRYRKAGAKLAHIERRLSAIAGECEALDDLAWEVDRADAQSLRDVADVFERIERGPKRARRTPERRRPPLEVILGTDARIYVGRSPLGNAELTFRIARPGDLWFHARATPGAHVVLHLDAPRAPEPGELEHAARLAAFHSKARSSEKVAVDYTERKHVRRQKNAAPGLVWYVNAKTLVVEPRDDEEGATR